MSFSSALLYRISKIFLLVYEIKPAVLASRCSLKLLVDAYLLAYVSKQFKNGCLSFKAILYSKTPNDQTKATESYLPNLSCSGDIRPR